MKTKHRKFRAGCTLVEMLGVLAIIAILMGLVSMGVLSAISKGRTVATMANLKNLETAVLSYVALSESGGKIPLTKVPTTALDKIQIASDDSAAANLDDAASGDLTSLRLEIPLIAAGLLDRNMSWRVGNDGIATGALSLEKEATWNRAKKAFVLYETEDERNAWTGYIRAECAPVVANAAPAMGDNSGLMSNEGVNFKLDGTSSLPVATRVAYVVLPGLSLNDAIKLSEEVNGSLSSVKSSDTAPAQTNGKFVFAAPASGADSVTGFYYLANI